MSDDYTFRGVQKLAHQLATHPAVIRCPRDGAVMRVLSTQAEGTGTHGPRQESFVGRPKEAGWRVTEMDVECPACRRRALRVRPVVEREEQAPAAL